MNLNKIFVLPVVLVSAFLIENSNLFVQKFEEGVISINHADDFDITFSPNQDQLYFSRRLANEQYPTIYTSRLTNGNWSEPIKTAFSTSFGEEYPSLSADGKTLLFASKRPRNMDGDSLDSNDLWIVNNKNGEWGEPTHLAGVLQSDGIDSGPVITNSRNIYFHSDRPGGVGSVDLYVAIYKNGEYIEAKNLTSLNSPGLDGEPYVDPDENYMIFMH